MVVNFIDAEGTPLVEGDVVACSDGHAYVVLEHAYPSVNIGYGIEARWRRGQWVEGTGSRTLFRAESSVRVDGLGQLPKVGSGEDSRKVVAGYYRHRFNNGPAIDLMGDRVGRNREIMRRIRRQHEENTKEAQ